MFCRKLGTKARRYSSCETFRGVRLGTVAMLVCLAIAAGMLAGCGTGGSGGGAGTSNGAEESSAASDESASTDASSEGASTKTKSKASGVVASANLRPQLIQQLTEEELTSAAPALSGTEMANGYGSVGSYTIESDLSNVSISSRVSLSDGCKDMLAANGFVVKGGGNAGYNEFFTQYEDNRYKKVPNFVTVDSMMHSYHIYFAYLLRGLESDQLSQKLLDASTAMLKESQTQLEDTRGTEWETAARRNVAYFSVACSLLDSSTEVPSEVSSEVSADVDSIEAASDTGTYQTTGEEADFTAYVPRGYYEGDESLERYFRAMTWYGQVNFTQEKEDLDRSALLITLGLHDAAVASWETVYAITGFFAGTSDDGTYYTYYPVAQQAYGDDVTTASVLSDSSAWTTYHELTAQLDAPKVSSLSSGATSEGTLDSEKGFRFMGQRFTLDEGIFEQLHDTELPHALDVPATLGSTEALTILQDEGKTTDTYTEDVAAVRADIEEGGDGVWTESLYSQWLYTLNPLLANKGEGYPTFMQSSAWNRKNLQTYMGSYAELKHDTILYSKQMLVEMGGEIVDEDDRGYVEPEPEVYQRLSRLSTATLEGLDGYGVLNDKDRSNLELLASLSDQLDAISRKELAEEGLTDEEYELIRSFGGQLEHFWDEVNADNSPEGNVYCRANSNPAAVVADIATDATSGTVLEVGTGKCYPIYVVVPVDGSLRVAVGSVYSFYEFEQPQSERLTDAEWREMIGLNSGSSSSDGDSPEPAEWTSEFTYTQG